MMRVQWPSFCRGRRCCHQSSPSGCCWPWPTWWWWSPPLPSTTTTPSSTSWPLAWPPPRSPTNSWSVPVSMCLSARWGRNNLNLKTESPGFSNVGIVVWSFCVWFSCQVAHMTKSEMALLDSSLVGPALLVLNQYFNTPFPEYLVLWICFVSDTCPLPMCHMYT